MLSILLFLIRLGWITGIWWQQGTTLLPPIPWGHLGTRSWFPKCPQDNPSLFWRSSDGHSCFSFYCFSPPQEPHHLHTGCGSRCSRCDFQLWNCVDPASWTRDSLLGKALCLACFHHLQILNNFWTRNPTFSFPIGPWKLWNQSCHGS